VPHRPHHHPQPRRLIRGTAALSLALIASAVLVTSMSCTTAPSQDRYANFQTAVAHAPQDGYTPYWLGRSFQAGGLTFVGPITGDPGYEVDGGGISMDYAAAVLKSGAVSVRLTDYTPAAWAKNGVGFQNAAGRAVEVAGLPATINEEAAGTRPVNDVWVIIHAGETTVLALVNAGGNPTPGGPELNPLIDEITLLNVLQHLRPYPQ
jgi:hypothetical protein